MRFQALMPDVLHWLGITKVDNMISMSDMKVRRLPPSLRLVLLPPPPLPRPPPPFPTLPYPSLPLPTSRHPPLRSIAPSRSLSYARRRAGLSRLVPRSERRVLTPGGFSGSPPQYDAIVNSGIEIRNRYDLPLELTPPDAMVEMDAKIVSGYGNGSRLVKPEDLHKTVGRAWEDLEH